MSDQGYAFDEKVRGGARPGALVDAAQRSSKTWCRSRLPGLSAMATLIPYVGVVSIAALFLWITWQFPNEERYVMRGVETLAQVLIAANVLWAALILVEFAAATLGSFRRLGREVFVVLAALTVVGLLQWLALNMQQAAHW